MPRGDELRTTVNGYPKSETKPKLENRKAATMKTTATSQKPSHASAQSEGTRHWAPTFHFLFSNLELPLLLAIICTSTALAADYATGWQTIDGGGGTSTNGQYSLRHHRPAGRRCDDGRSVHPGRRFLGPHLSRANTRRAVALRHAHPDQHRARLLARPGSGLEVASDHLTATPVVWTPLPPPYQVSGTNLSFIEAAPTGNKFYRLQKP